MKVMKATNEHKKMIQLHWKEYFSEDEVGPIDFYFEELYKPEQSYVLIDDSKVIASCQVHPHQMVLHDKIIETSFIVGLYTIASRRDEGNMKYLLNRVLMEREKVELITLVHSCQKGLFRQFGFESVYEKNVYMITRSMVPMMDSGGVRLNVSDKELLDLYRFYTKYFNGYFVRDESYYKWMKKALSTKDGRYLGVYDSEGDLRASIRLLTQGQTAIIEELLYKDTAAIMKLISFVLSQYPLVRLSMTLAEDFQKIVNNVPSEKEAYLYVRLNQSNVFERLYNVKVKTADSAMNAFQRPLFNSDFY